MPIFEFKCENCQFQFERMLSNAEKDKLKCPECGSVNIKQRLSLFNTGSSPSKNNFASCHGDCCSCCHGK